MAAAVAFAGLLLAAAGPAEPTRTSALAAAEAGRYATAARELTFLAERGDAVAQYELGRLYRHGHGVPQDPVRAVAWYEKAAAQGYALAQNNLGFMYTKGLGVRQDKRLGFRWYVTAARQGVGVAQYNAGLKLYYGEGVPQNVPAAFRWMLAAARQGCREAVNFTGYLYEVGHGTPINRPRAALWYQLGVEAGDEQARQNLSRLAQDADGDALLGALARDYPPFRKSIAVEAYGVDPDGGCAWRGPLPAGV